MRGQVKFMTRRADLVRGVALALAELERFDRAAGPPAPGAKTRGAADPVCVDRCDSPVCFECKDR